MTKSDFPLSNEHYRDELLPGELQQAGQAASNAAARHSFLTYQERKAEETLRRQRADLDLFSEFLYNFGLRTLNFYTDPEAWSGITWGLVEGFIKWQIEKGYAVPSINIRISTIKTYARLAMQSGNLLPQEYALIKSIKSYSQQEKRRIDERRPQNRVGLKKSTPVIISPEQAGKLKTQPNTPQGRRDQVMMCLLLDHGLRVGELVGLDIEDIDLESGLLHFFRPKVGKTQSHRLSKDTFQSLQSYKDLGDMPFRGPLLRRSLKNEELSSQGMTQRAVTKRVKTLGEHIGIFGLSAHDCRHYWATTAARHGTDPFRLQEAGGWSSLAMPRRYVEDNKISNDGIILNNPLEGD